MPEDHNKTKEGIIKWFNEEKDEGFILDLDNNLEVELSSVVIQSEDLKTLNGGQKVFFKVTQGPDGNLQAENVVLCSGPHGPGKTIDS